jgi:hypothetical protein
MQSVQNTTLFVIIIIIIIIIIISSFAVTELRFYEFLLLLIAFKKFYKHGLHPGTNLKCVKL